MPRWVWLCHLSVNAGSGSERMKEYLPGFWQVFFWIRTRLQTKAECVKQEFKRGLFEKAKTRTIEMDEGILLCIYFWIFLQILISIYACIPNLYFSVFFGIERFPAGSTKIHA